MGVRQSRGALAGWGLSRAQPMGCCLPAKPSLLSGIESLSLPLNQTGGVGQLTSWWFTQAELHTRTCAFAECFLNTVKHIFFPSVQ